MLPSPAGTWKPLWVPGYKFSWFLTPGPRVPGGFILGQGGLVTAFSNSLCVFEPLAGYTGQHSAVVPGRKQKSEIRQASRLGCKGREQERPLDLRCSHGGWTVPLHIQPWVHLHDEGPGIISPALSNRCFQVSFVSEQASKASPDEILQETQSHFFNT